MGKRHKLLSILAALLLALLLFPAWAGADGPSRVGLVVRFGDGSVFTKCVEFEEDQISGLEVLLRSGLRVVYQQSGLGAAVCKIEDDGCDYPSEPCFCKCLGGPNCVYWSYWHLKGGEWQYSPIGASGYFVRDGDVEGWAWGPGTAGSGLEPPVIDFNSICAPPPTATLTPTAAPTYTPIPSPTPTLTPLPPTATRTPAPPTPVPPTSTPTPVPIPPTDTPTPTATQKPPETETPTPTPTLTSTPVPATATPIPRPKATKPAAPPTATPTETATSTATPTPSAVIGSQARAASPTPRADVGIVKAVPTTDRGKADRLRGYSLFAVIVIGLLATLIVFRIHRPE